MKQKDFNDAFTLLSSGTSRLNQHGEVEWKDGRVKLVYISFPTLSPTYAVVSYYHENGNKSCKSEYQNGKLHGKYTGWYYDGNKGWEIEYQNGKKHGRSLAWYNNGNKLWEIEYQNGKRHGKETHWVEDGNKYSEAEYKNGRRIR